MFLQGFLGKQSAKQNIVAVSNSSEIPQEIKRLVAFYPVTFDSISQDLVFLDGTRMPIKVKKSLKSHIDIDNPSIMDMFCQAYPLGDSFQHVLQAKSDPGRYRNMDFFMKIYGNTPQAVEKNLVTLVFCPKISPQKIQVTRVMGIDSIFRNLSAALDSHPEFKPYLQNIGGTYNWRKIKGTNRISMHSFGMTIDLNIKHSHYWQWDCNCHDETKTLTYRNKIPIELVKIFERFGFIWGGKWTHYDTMHFEYRPELIFEVD
jgi:hypothetical protein